MNLADYKKKNLKTVTLPSGLEVTFRKLTVADTVDFGLMGQDLSNQETIKAGIDMLAACLVNPKCTKEPSSVDSDSLSVYDIEIEDSNFLQNEINVFSGFVEPEEKKPEDQSPET